MKPYPFVKWAGGKRQLINQLLKHKPKAFHRYYEPFLGGGALFFELIYQNPTMKATISDLNPELINAYQIVKKDVEGLIKDLKQRQKLFLKNRKPYYLKVRAEEFTTNLKRASRFIFLNRTAFNGLYRVNSKGQFNVPMGNYKNPKICNEENLREVSKILNYPNVTLKHPISFLTATSFVKKNDFIYFDPPYEPLNKTASFTSYTQNGFTFQDQQTLAKEAERLRQSGVHILLSNSNMKKIIKLYTNFKIEKVTAKRSISCKGETRKPIKELLIVG